jgi:two-component system chemotaxis response regulator CheB
MPMNEKPIRVLVVDDSAFMRFSITRHLSETPGLQVVGAARDGVEALALIPQLKPDVVTLDVEMPRMDGLTVLREIMAHQPLPVIMLSSLTSEGARETVQALTWGAVDFVTKPASKANIESVIEEVVWKIRRAAGSRIDANPLARRPEPLQAPVERKPGRSLRRDDRVVIIGASTGGPRALNTLITQLPAELPAAVVIVQHMPAGFTRSLAERLDSLSQLAVKEAAPGDKLETGRALIAPGGFHLTFDSAGSAAVNQNPPVHGVRPAVDVTMASLAQHFGPATLGIVLTGMGCDGALGATLIRAAGGRMIAEEESTCVVYGMPRSVIEAGQADQIAPLHKIAAAIEQIVRV